MRKTVALDFETHLISEKAILPKPVCLVLSSRDDLSALLPGTAVWRRDGVNSYLLGNDDRHAFGVVLTKLLSDSETHLVGANLAFDLGVATYDDPALIPLIFGAGIGGRLHDIMIIDRLIRLATSGQMEFYTLPDGTTKDVQYSLTALEKRLININRESDKEGEDIWRLRYSALDGVHANDYPAGAREYALADGWGTLRCYEELISKVTPRGHGSANTEEFQALVDYCLMLMTAHGLDIDKEQVDRLDEALSIVLSEENHRPLYEAGLLTRPTPERIRRTKKGEIMRHKTGQYAGQPILVEGKPEAVKTRALQEHVLNLYKMLEITNHKLTPKGVELGVFPGHEDYLKYVSVDHEVLVDLAPLDPSGLLEVFSTRQKYAKIRNSYLPVLLKAERLHPGYNVLVSTGRSSSRGGGRKPLYPTMSIQVLPRMEEGHLNVRATLVPRKDHVFCSIDFDALELCSFAQKCYSLFGHSALREVINKGQDPHAFLGAQLAAALNPEFSKVVRDLGITSKDEIYAAFVKLKKCGDPDLESLYKHYRTFAKPVGLGLPGGLGIKTLRVTAKAIYGVVIESDQLAQTFKDLWLDTYPEAAEYLRVWVPSQEDRHNAGDDLGGLCYESPMGMFRANTNYCATANGAALQTPSAEGFKLALVDCIERCVNRERGDPLFGSMQVAQVHDEIVFELPRDRAKSLGIHAAKAMCDNMQSIMPDVTIRAKPAFMTRWLKGAEGENLLWSLGVDGKLYSEPF